MAGQRSYWGGAHDDGPIFVAGLSSMFKNRDSETFFDMLKN